MERVAFRVRRTAHRLRRFRLPSVTFSIGSVPATIGLGFVLQCSFNGVLEAIAFKDRQPSSSASSLIGVGVTGSLQQLASSIIHESGHAIAFTLSGHPIKEAGADATRAYVVTDDLSSVAAPTVVVGVLGGPAANLALAGILYQMQRCLEDGTMKWILSRGTSHNLSNGFYNLLPMPAFDGGKLLDLALDRHIPDENVRNAVLLGLGLAGNVAWYRFRAAERLMQLVEASPE